MRQPLQRSSQPSPRHAQHGPPHVRLYCPASPLTHMVFLPDFICRGNVTTLGPRQSCPRLWDGSLSWLLEQVRHLTRCSDVSLVTVTHPRSRQCQKVLPCATATDSRHAYHCRSAPQLSAMCPQTTPELAAVNCTVIQSTLIMCLCHITMLTSLHSADTPPHHHYTHTEAFLHPK